jgi:hypothetical protein
VGPTLLSAVFDSGFLAQEYTSKYKQLQYPKKAKSTSKANAKAADKSVRPIWAMRFELSQNPA